jgi:hypothetical protein
MIYKSGDIEFVGKIPVKQEITVLDADEPKNKLIGWTCYETIGIGIVNARGIGKFSIHEIYDWKFND